ncbi:hypothetical protein Vafri_11867 [Volvox africanus]|uniref:Uncharacterized protein n=1 Tax=Volvox africanus TaxID=51714 RepID=A0A8J4B8Y7_9CHLO|nr:hypothetical protein Vafri_11867 [Volvox africanus]
MSWSTHGTPPAPPCAYISLCRGFLPPSPLLVHVPVRGWTNPTHKDGQQHNTVPDGQQYEHGEHFEDGGEDIMLCSGHGENCKEGRHSAVPNRPSNLNQRLVSALLPCACPDV